MNDLISRQAAIEETWKEPSYTDPLNVLTEVRDRLKALSSAQPQPIVRCKDCKYWQDNNGGYHHEDCRWGHDETPDGDDFCSFAESRTI